MVFSTTNLFKGIQCPEGTRCSLTNCIFGHDLQPQQSSAISKVSKDVPFPKIAPTSSTEPVEPPAKKRKVTYGSLAEKPPSRADQIREQLAASRVQKQAAEVKQEILAPSGIVNGSATVSKSLACPISPPAIHHAKPAPPSGPKIGTISNVASRPSVTATQIKTEIKAENLNPRLIPNDPAGHSKRSLFLKHLHAEMTRLNEKVEGNVPPDLKTVLPLSSQMVIKIVLDEEEKVAREQPSVYGNIIKSRIAQLKKISVEDWIKQIRVLLPNSKPGNEVNSNEKPIDTRLPLDQEVLILPHLVSDQSNLHNFEYIVNPPSDEKIAAAKAGVEQSKNYEECDRCAARFQVFPDRNDEGQLTSNGPCRYHPNRKVFPPRQRTDAQTGPKQPYYPCCMEPVGAPGCTLHDSHVFKTTSPGRLAAVLPFITTPENPSPARDRDGQVVKAITFDCEMGYTTFGIELIRLTAVTWPDKKDLIDVLVRPLGAIIDLNSRFSGVFPEHFTNAVPLEQWDASLSSSSITKPADEADTSTTTILPLVSSPSAARELLISYLTPTTFLLGHAINNDLTATRLCHQTIIDTVILFPHPRGLPMRLGLKALTHRILNRSIQTGGERGHDSKEDAVATGDLVRWKVGEKWKAMRATGWTMEGKGNGAKLVAPASKAATAAETSEVIGAKRKRHGEEDDDEGLEIKAES